MLNLIGGSTEVENNKFVFLGGTTANDTWRVKLISMLTPAINYFNPVVSNYDDVAKVNEDHAKEQATHMVYVITPNMKSFYSIAEMTEDAVLKKRPVIICFLDAHSPAKIGFTEDQLRGFSLVMQLLSKYPTVKISHSLEDIANILNE